MSEYKGTIKKWKSVGSIWDILYPKTTIDQVINLSTTLANMQSEVDDKVAANTTITGGTKAKITYDAKGLVTGGANLLSTDIPSLPVTHLNPGASNVGKFAKATSSTQAGWGSIYDNDMFLSAELGFLGFTPGDYMSDVMNSIDYSISDLYSNKAPNNMPLSAFTSSVYLTSSHYNRLLYSNTTSAITLYLQTAPIGTEIHFLRYSTGELTIGAGASQTILSEGSKKRINAQYQAATAKCIAANTWVLFGALKA